MNGIHDVGGMGGFGKVDPQDDEGFHEDWERQVRAIISLVRVGGVDEFRFTIESLPPVDYLSLGYFGRWLLAREKMLVKYGLLTEEELKNPEGRLARTAGYQAVTPAQAGTRTSRSKRMQLDVPPRFQVGDRVRVKNAHPRGHTRHPRYVR